MILLPSKSYNGIIDYINRNYACSFYHCFLVVLTLNFIIKFSCLLVDQIDMSFTEGKGSLLYFLKAKGWATALSAGVGEEGMRRSSIAYIFVMSIHLTDAGLDMVFLIS